MGRFALLVGVSEYGNGYESLPGSETDLAQMQQVLEDTNMGGFRVEKLLNPNPQALREKIENFFRDSIKSEDVLLFYFSGHGVLDRLTGSQLYLSTSETRKDGQQLVESSAVEAAFLHRHLANSESNQKIVILDCCFSGAVANLRQKGDSTVNLEPLKASGTAILASCSSFGVSYQTQTETVGSLSQSIYTRYLVEGISTGAARQSNNDWILTRDLHEYTKLR